MAYRCRRGERDCDGCGACRKEPADYRCPICGQLVEEKVYVTRGEVVGCDQCVREMNFWEVGIYA